MGTRKYPQTRNVSCKNCGKKLKVYLERKIDPRKPFYCDDICRRAYWEKTHGKPLAEGKARRKEANKQKWQKDIALWGQQKGAVVMTEAKMKRFGWATKRKKVKPRSPSKMTERDIEYWAAYRRELLGVPTSHSDNA